MAKITAGATIGLDSVPVIVEVDIASLISRCPEAYSWFQQANEKLNRVLTLEEKLQKVKRLSIVV